MGLQTIVSRGSTSQGALGRHRGHDPAGNRDNIIPDDVTMLGTIRAFDRNAHQIHEHVKPSPR